MCQPCLVQKNIDVNEAMITANGPAPSTVVPSVPNTANNPPAVNIKIRNGATYG